jgi:hypothetical protein
MSSMRLDTKRIRRLCGEHRITTRQLAASIGAGAPRMSDLLAGSGGVENLTLKELKRLGERLGIDGMELVVLEERPRRGPPPSSDAVKLHAVMSRAGRALVRRDISDVLGWDLRRVKAAIAEVDAMLEGTGELLHRIGCQFLVLRPRDSVLSDQERVRADRLQLHYVGLDLRSARLVTRLIEAGGALGATSSNAQLFERRTVIKHGLAEVGPRGELRLHKDVMFSLGVDDSE